MSIIAFATIEQAGKPITSKTFASIRAANESAKALIRNGAYRVTVRNAENMHVRTWVRTGQNNHKPRSFTCDYTKAMIPA